MNSTQSINYLAGLGYSGRHQMCRSFRAGDCALVALGGSFVGGELGKERKCLLQQVCSYKCYMRATAACLTGEKIECLQLGPKKCMALENGPLYEHVRLLQ